MYNCYFKSTLDVKMTVKKYKIIKIEKKQGNKKYMRIKFKEK